MQKVVLTQKGMQLTNELISGIDREDSPPSFVKEARPQNLTYKSLSRNQKPYFIIKTQTISKQNAVYNNTANQSVFLRPISTAQEGSRQENDNKNSKSTSYINYKDFQKQIRRNPEEFMNTFKQDSTQNNPYQYSRIQTAQQLSRNQLSRGSNRGAMSSHNNNISRYGIGGGSYQSLQYHDGYINNNMNHNNNQQQYQSLMQTNQELEDQKNERKMQKTLQYMDNEIANKQKLEKKLQQKNEGLTDSVSHAIHFLQDLKTSPIQYLDNYQQQSKQREIQRVFEIQRQKYNKMWKGLYIPGGKKEELKQDSVKNEAMSHHLDQQRHKFSKYIKINNNIENNVQQQQDQQLQLQKQQSSKQELRKQQSNNSIIAGNKPQDSTRVKRVSYVQQELQSK